MYKRNGVQFHSFVALLTCIVVKFMLVPLYLQERSPVLTEYVVEWVWTFWRRIKSLDPAGLWTTDHSALSMVTILSALLAPIVTNVCQILFVTPR
jgi:uncharacterized membrane protein